MFSRKTKYGLLAVFYLAEMYRKGPVLIADIAEHRSLPKKFLESILLELNKKGILHSQKGKGGGYSLKRPPDEIMLGEVIRALEGTLAPVSCVSQMAYKKCEECMDERVCVIRCVMKEVREALAGVLDQKSLAKAMRQRDIAVENSALSYSI